MKKIMLVSLMVLALLLQGCASKKSDNDQSLVSNTESTEEEKADSKTEDEGEKTMNNNTAKDTKTSEDDTQDSSTVNATGTPEEGSDKEESDLVLPVTENDTGKVLIQTVSGNHAYLYTSYIITSSNGESVVVDPTMMPDPSVVEINPSAIICTHSHPDHTDADYTAGYDVPKMLYKVGEIQTKDFNIYSIASAHSGDTVTGNGTNLLVVFEVDGLRIVHMGDIGQTKLTDEQLEALGDIDIAFMQFENSYSSMSLDNEKGFQLIEQLNPKIIIPTHYTPKAVPVLEEKYGTITQYENMLEISKEDIPDTACNVTMISNTHKYN
jgi:L-ascorbate metabolism protein UlaG (beta-lactamase superfamily)